MKINLNEIKPSPKPIRSSWDELKLNELKWSLMEEGQVEPIGVHSNGHGYIIVWGHRRVEAARRAGWNDIEAVVVPQDEVNNLIQAGIENLAGEDMSADDKAEWAQRLIELGLSQSEISRRSTIPQRTLSDWLVYRREKAMGASVITRKDIRDEGVASTVIISHALGNDLEAKKAIAAKVSDDRLSQSQTRAVADAYRDAPTPEVKAAVLRQPIISRDTSADILRRSVAHAEREGVYKSMDETIEFEKEREERRTMQAWDTAVKEFLDMIRLFRELVIKVPTFVKYGKYSPEAARFAIRKIDNLIDDLKTCKEELENVK
jgi:ParB/RepB/Spo0J family partition protein